MDSSPSRATTVMALLLALQGLLLATAVLAWPRSETRCKPARAPAEMKTPIDIPWGGGS